jgi:hypothetical protein
MAGVRLSVLSFRNMFGSALCMAVSCTNIAKSRAPDQFFRAVGK